MTLTGFVRSLRHPKFGNPSACGEKEVVIVKYSEGGTLREEFGVEAVEVIDDKIEVTLIHKRYRV